MTQRPPMPASTTSSADAVRASLARIIVELQRLDQHLAAGALAGCAFSTTDNTSERRAGVDLLRIEQVAERTGIAVSTLRHWRQRGVGPDASRIGRRLVYRVADVDRWLAEQWPAV